MGSPDFFSKKLEETETRTEWPSFGPQTDDILKLAKKLDKLKMVTLDKRVDGETICQFNRGWARFPALERFWSFNESQENRLSILSYLLPKKIR